VDVTPPTIVTLNPTDNATGVSVANWVYTINFNEGIQVGSGIISLKRSSNDGLIGTAAIGTVRALVSGSQLTIDFNADGGLGSFEMDNSTEYYIEIPAGTVEDLAGNNFAGIAKPDWSFTTGGDITAPVITSLSPLLGAVDVAIDANFVLTFNEDVQLTGTGGFSIFNKATGVRIGPNFFFPGGATVSGNSVTYDRPIDMPYATEIYINIENALEDLAGNNVVDINDNSTWVFTTEANPDATAPTVTSLSPLNNGLDIPINNNLIIVFDENVQKGSGSIHIKRIDNDDLLETIDVGAGLVTINNANASINPDIDLPYGVEIYIEIESGAFKDLAGNDFAGITKPDWSFTTEKQDQTINFTALTDKTFGDADFNLTATASSGLVVMYASSDETVATISGSTVTIVGAGSTIITASQGGNVNYNAATNVPQTLTVDKANQIISFSSLANKTFGDSDFDLTATASSGLVVSYASSDETVVTISGSTVSIIGAGSTMITASQVGDANFNAASDVVQNLIINKASQVITIISIGDKLITDADFDVIASTTSGLSLDYSVSGPASISGNTITLDGTSGTVLVMVDQVGNANYNLAQANTSFNVIDNSKQDQTISFDAIADKVFGDSPFALNATASSGLAVSFEVVSGAASISGIMLTITGTGQIMVRASQSGDGTFNPAPVIEQSFTVAKAEQTITITAIADKLTTDSAFELVASTTSGLELDYSVSGPASIAGTTITLDGSEGTVTVTVSQTGNDDFNAANAETTFEVTAPEKAEQTITITTIDDKLSTDAAFDVVASTTSGLALDYAVAGPATIAGTTITLDGTEGTVTVTVSQTGDDDFNPASAETTFEVTTPGKEDQTLTITPIADKLTTDAAFDVVASTTSGLGLEYVVTGPASISGNTITLDGAEGTVTVTVSQAGDDDFNAASAETAFEVSTPPKLDQTITFNPIDDQIIEAGSLLLAATASSGLDVTYEIVSGPASVTNDEVTFNDFGTVTIKASQAGNEAFNPAPDIEQVFEIVTITGLTFEKAQTIQIYPNPTADFVNINGEYYAIQIVSTSGKVVYQDSNNSKQINLSSLIPGSYIVMISTKSGTETLRLLKN